MKKWALILFICGLFMRCDTESTNFQNCFQLHLDVISSTISQVKESVVYSSWDTTINIYNLTTNKKIFSRHITDVCYARPILKSNKLYFPFSDSQFVCMQMSDNKILWEMRLHDRCKNFDFINDSLIVASEHSEGLSVFNAKNGKRLYELKYDYNETHLPALSPWKISYDSNSLYVSNWQACVLSSFKTINGSMNWRVKDTGLNMSSQSIVIGKKLFIEIDDRNLRARIFLYEKSNGKLLTILPSDLGQASSIVTYMDNMYFCSYDGSFNKFDLNTNKITVIKKFDEKSDLGFNEMFLLSDEIIFTDASYYIVSYSISKNQFARLKKADKAVIGAFEYDGIKYFIY